MLNFKKVKEFTQSLGAERFPLKLMGIKFDPCATMLAAIYKDIDDPKKNSQEIYTSTILGNITYRGIELDSDYAYSSQMDPPEENELNLLQGDLITYSCNDLKHHYSMVLSHSCDLSKSSFISICPVFLDTELDEQVMRELRKRPFKDSNAIKNAKEDWFANTNFQIAGFPSNTSAGIERFLAVISLPFSVKINKITHLSPVLRLSYRSLAFLQWRIGMLYMRDVQNSDDVRDF